ncbi:MAG: rod shape-determining protein MreD [Desulfobulbaceae bacterium]|uniref:Rod shape-determining protein MreD n=1 Tax=Candidatus Desulfatifera sulfidica TaxID=2841691 RepID=A0A8J6N8L3_9BACT|nr:rod shape-determining protein MreD [Candidatus Desulfatifera sulfidica]
MLVTFVFFLLALLLLAVQTTIFQFFPVWLGSPDLLFVLVVFVAYRFDWVRGLLLVIFYGWMMDVVSGFYLGIYPVLYFLVFILLKILAEKSPIREGLYQIPMIGASYFVVQLLFYVFFIIIQPDALLEWRWSQVIKETFVLLVASIPCFLALNRLFEIFAGRRFASRILLRRSGNRFR